MTDLERKMHLYNVAYVVRIEAMWAAIERGIISWEDYPELPEGVWAEIVEHLREIQHQVRETVTGFNDSYAALADLAEEV